MNFLLCRYKSKSLPQANSPHLPSLVPFFLRLLFFFIKVCFVPFCLASSFLNLVTIETFFPFFFQSRRCHANFTVFHAFNNIDSSFFSSHDCHLFLVGCALDFYSMTMFFWRKKNVLQTINHETHFYLKAIKKSWAYGLNKNNLKCRYFMIWVNSIRNIKQYQNFMLNAFRTSILPWEYKAYIFSS